MTDVELRVFDTAEEAREAAAKELAEAARAGVHIALSGGSAPGGAYELAARLEPDWSRAEVWWGDERCVHPADSRSNYRLARERLFDALARLPRAVHRIRGELDPEEAAARYDAEIADVQLGLAFQGIGPDGHTASLFPGSPALEERERRALTVPHDDVPRVTLTLPVLCGAETVLFLVLGTEKVAAVRAALAEPPSPKIPASLVRSSDGRTLAVLDRAAAAGLPS